MVAKVYQNDETQLIWNDTSTPRTFGLNNLAATTGIRQGDLFDLGASARAHRFAWRGWVQFATAPVVKEAVRIFIKTSDGTIPDNDDGVTDANVSSVDKLENLLQIGSIIVDEAAIGVKMVANGLIVLPHQWIAPVFQNLAADNLVATNDLSGFALTPIPFESQ